ncbi:MAG: hypothetical protein D8M59_05725 [Planctomycetes bacterium]|nr:hypothetical protein [Planctomycetota bacterium]NOG55919.1 hypothetical protein [Planctomycetota bacterium]
MNIEMTNQRGSGNPILRRHRSTAGAGRITRILAAVTMLGIALCCTLSTAAYADEAIGWVTLDGPLMEKPDPFAWIVGEDPDGTLAGVVSKFDDAASRRDMPAVMIHLKDVQLNRSQMQTIGEAIQRVRDAGKEVSVFATNYGPGELLLGCYADRIIIQPGGIVSFPGMYVEEMFLADTLGLIGIKADMLQVGDYKGASEQMARSTPSPEWSENIDRLLDDLWDQMCEQIATGRDFDDAELDHALRQGWLAPWDRAIDIGLVDEAIDIVDLTDRISDEYAGARITQTLGDVRAGDSISLGEFSEVMKFYSRLFAGPDHTIRRNTIAVVYIDGTIIDGESTQGGLFGGGESTGDRTVRKALKTIEDDDRIKGLVVRINSPGGSAIASEMIWQGLRRVAEHKPVFISIGTMAASGGYYCAVGGDRIYVDPGSIVGSIGVVSGKLVMGGLYDKLKVGITPRARGPMAHLNSSTEPFSPHEREALESWMVEVYDLFANHVKQARGSRVDLDDIAEGRLFTGRQAIDNGMADGIADFTETVSMLADEAGLIDGTYDVMTFPGPQSFEDMIEQMFPFLAQAGMRDIPAALGRDLGVAAVDGVLRQIVGPDQWGEVSNALNGLMLLQQEPVVLVAPRILIFK